MTDKNLTIIMDATRETLEDIAASLLKMGIELHGAQFKYDTDAEGEPRVVARLTYTAPETEK